jgi:hypothetical protein
MDEIDRILSGELPAAALAGIDLEATLLVSRRVLAGRDVLFAWRDEPCDEDSGWTLLAGDEPDAWVEDRGNFEERTLRWALEHDPRLCEILAAPPDSAYERDGRGDAWVEIEDDG